MRTSLRLSSSGFLRVFGTGPAQLNVGTVMIIVYFSQDDNRDVNSFQNLDFRVVIERFS